MCCWHVTFHHTASGSARLQDYTAAGVSSSRRLLLLFTTRNKNRCPASLGSLSYQIKRHVVGNAKFSGSPEMKINKYNEQNVAEMEDKLLRTHHHIVQKKQPGPITIKPFDVYP